MAEHEPHCPFLNRADYRCSNHFSLDKLNRAFDHCFGEYQACPTYLEMLSERQSRQPAGLPGQGRFAGTVVYANLTVGKRPASGTLKPPASATKHAAAA